MKKLVAGLFFILALTMMAAPDGRVVRMEGSFLEPLQPRDSVLIGDQFRYGFHLKGIPEGTPVLLADLSKGLRDSVEVVSQWRLDTVRVYGGRKEKKTYDIDASVIITSFDEGTYILPELPLLMGDGKGGADTLVFNSQTLEVGTIQVDTTTYKIHDIKGQIKYPVTFAEVLPYLLGFWGISLLAILIWALLASRRRIEAEGPTHNDPPYLVALRRLDRFRGDKYWAPEKQKTFYSGITDTLREYIDARYGIDAPEMTTAEIFDGLKHSDIPADIYEEVKSLFETADLVKFAKAFASDEENAAALPAAVRFVTATYQEQIGGETSPVKEKEGSSDVL